MRQKVKQGQQGFFERHKSFFFDQSRLNPGSGLLLGLQSTSACSNEQMISTILNDDVGALAGCIWVIYTSYPSYLIFSNG